MRALPCSILTVLPSISSSISALLGAVEANDRVPTRDLASDRLDASLSMSGMVNEGRDLGEESDDPTTRQEDRDEGDGEQ